MKMRGRGFFAVGPCRLLVCALVVLVGTGPLMAQQGRGNRAIANLERQLAELERALAALQGGGSQEAAAEYDPSKLPPGINDTWKSENIDPLINLLEGESREIYTLRELLAAVAGPQEGSVIADIGAGSGFMVEEFSKLVGPEGKVYAVDINATMMEHVDKMAKEKGLTNIETVVCPEDSTNLPANSVDMVFMCDTYHHFEQLEGTMNSIRRALKPGGQIVLVEFKRYPGSRMERHVRANREVFTKEITGFGFELINSHFLPELKENYILRFRKTGRRR